MINQILSKLSDEEIICLSKEYGLMAIPNDSPLRELTKRSLGDDSLSNMLTLGISIAMELGKRLEAIVGREESNPYGLTKKVIEDYFLKASEEEGNSEEALNIDIVYDHEVLTIEFDVDADGYGIQSGSYVKILPDGRVIVNFCDYLEGGGVEVVFREYIEEHLKSFYKNR